MKEVSHLSIHHPANSLDIVAAMRVKKLRLGFELDHFREVARNSKLLLLFAQ
jgi:hypothetical protein